MAEDEWEYEYDEEETETFYIPVDLANVPLAQGSVASLFKSTYPNFARSKLRAAPAQTVTQANDASSPKSSPNAHDYLAMGTIQILGLHTEAPLITYNGQLLSCQWKSTLGTDVLFTKPSLEPGGSDRPIRSLSSANLLAIASARLVAHPAQLRPRDDIVEQVAIGTQTMDQLIDAGPTDNVTSGPSDSLPQNTPKTSDFLAKLNAAKAKRGEISRLTSVRTFDGSRLVKEHDDSPSDSGNVDANDIEMGET